MAGLRGDAVWALVLGIFGCGAQRVEPAPTGHAPAHVVPTSTALASASPTTPTAQASAPSSTPTTPAPGATLTAQATQRDELAPTDGAPSNNSPWTPPPELSHWRPAVENYVPSATEKNKEPLGEAAKPFAYYLNQVHARIHPFFADQFLTSLDALPTSHPMNRFDLHVTIEIVLEPKKGRIHRMGVATPSGITAFDVMALESVNRAQPFGPPPREIVSSDGFVYLHWGFHRGPEACSTWDAHPFLLNITPNPAPTPP